MLMYLVLYVTTGNVNVFSSRGALKISFAALMLKVMKIIRDRKEGKKEALYMTDEDAK